MNQYGQPPPYAENVGYVPSSAHYQQGGQTIYPPMPPQPTQPPQATHSTLIIHSTNTPSIVTLGANSTRITCPSCHADVMTNIEHNANSRTHCWAILLCLFVMWPLMFLPYCCKACRNADHYCPSCGTYLGTYAK